MVVCVALGMMIEKIFYYSISYVQFIGLYAIYYVVV